LTSRTQYFGAGHRLLGSLHVPTRLRPRSTAVILCNPFSEEASRAHRTYRVLATHLERAGYPVLRFDYGGTGDSLGEGTDATIDGWRADIVEAAEHLCAVTGATRVTLVGLRLGATLAALATSAGPRVRHLIMWDPIVDGGAYLAELAVQHRSYLREEFGGMYRDRLRLRADGAPTEALGAPIGEPLARGLAQLDLSTVAPAADTVTVVTTRPSADTARLRAQLSPETRWIELRESTAWNDDAALNAMVVPMEIVQAIVSRVQEVSG
jgi:pimeloyl-ACP methyl ester carboxylesterase